MSANRLPAADEDLFCVKRRKIRSGRPRRQVIPLDSVDSPLPGRMKQPGGFRGDCI